MENEQQEEEGSGDFIYNQQVTEGEGRHGRCLNTAPDKGGANSAGADKRGRERGRESVCVREKTRRAGGGGG